MLNYNVKIGLVPLRRDCTPRPGAFNWEIAEERGRKIVAYIEEHYATENVSFADLKGVIDVETFYAERDVQKVADHMRAEKVDALLMINANFGCEEAAAQLAQALNVPVLLWAPMDDRFDPDGMRYTDSQCGIFGISRQMQRYNIPFSFLNSCTVDSEKFADGLDHFARVACMVKNFRGMRIGQVGMRPKIFCSVIFNEGELMQRFGLHIIPINNAIIEEKFKKIMAERDDELNAGEQEFLRRYDVDDFTKPLLKRIYAFVLLFKELTEEYNLDVISSECWTSMEKITGVLPCAAYGFLLDQGYLVSCESDMHASITMALLSCASFGREVPCFGEFTVRHPSDANVELLWHCGPFPYSLHRDDKKPIIYVQRQWFQAREGKYTVARFDQEDGKYMILNGTCESAEGPFTNGNYIWGRFNDLDKWERRLVEGPYIHHVVEIRGDYTREIQEFCKYFPNVVPDSMN